MVAYCTNDAVAETARRCQTELQSMASTLKSPEQLKKKQACLTLAEQARQEAERSDKLAAAGDEAQLLRHLPAWASKEMAEIGIYRYALPPELGGGMVTRSCPR